MKLKGLILSLFTLTCILLHAQNWSTEEYIYGEQYPGYVINKSGEKIEGYIKYRNRYAMQNDVVLYKVKDNNNTKVKFNAEDILEYMVADKLYHCINYSGESMSSVIKANLLVKDGCIKEYVWYNRADSYNTLRKRPGESSEDFGNRMFPSQTVYYKDGDDIGVTDEFFSTDFEKKMSAYVKLNKELSKKIKSKMKGYESHKTKAIIEEYNANCQ